MSSGSNRFVSLAITRFLTMSAVAEVSWIGFFVIVTFSGILVPSTNVVEGATLTNFFGLIALLASSVLAWQFSGQRVPFDLIEAESELMDGTSTEIAGHNFSFFYAAEVVLVLLIIKIYSSLGPASSIGVFVALILLSFLGRLSLSRFLLRDSVALILGNSLWQIPNALALI